MLLKVIGHHHHWFELMPPIATMLSRTQKFNLF